MPYPNQNTVLSSPVLKYEYMNITLILKMIPLIKENYTIVSSVKISSKKGSYVVVDKFGEKLFLKAKLKDFINPNEVEVYKKIKENPHKNINNVYSVNETNKFVLVFLEYIDGFDMTRSSCIPLYKNNIGNVFVQLLSGIQHLHSLGISHCDINPSNIMFDSKKKIPMLIDYDLARLSENINVFSSYGSEGFISPEIKNGSFTDKTDDWGLATTITYCMSNFKELKSVKLPTQLANQIEQMCDDDHNRRPDRQNVIKMLSLVRS